MKTFARALLLILLACAIVFGTAWYLLKYDTDFTHDMLLEGARFFEDKNQYAISTWLYDAAFKYSTSVDEISLELAECYWSAGNFTKVERTLFEAIERGGGAEIYLALSRAFVAQDKLLDALRLIEGIEDPAIRNQLELLRPTAPTASIPSGHYNEYLSLNFAAEAGTIYVSTAATPSVRNDLYDAPISLQAGETTLFAVAVSENGLVSPVSKHEYTIKGVIEQVVFSDSAMESAIRQALGIPEGIPVYTNELWELRTLAIPEKARSYADLKYLPFLENLTVTNAQDSLSAIAEMESLKTLSIQKTPIDAETLQNILKHTALTSLTLRDCSITSLLGFEKLTELTYLDIGENVLRNLTPLSQLPKLEVLYLDHNAVVELNALQKLTTLQELDLSYNSITSLKPLTSLSALQKLNLRSNLLQDAASIGKLTALTYLDLSYNKLTSISSLSTCKELTELLISNNKITSISSVAKLMKLERLDFANNKVETIPALNKKCMLYAFDGSYNKIKDVKPLSGLGNLCTVTLDYNKDLKDVKPLTKCPNLGMLSVYGTKVKDISAFVDLEITIYYNPT